MSLYMTCTLEIQIKLTILKYGIILEYKFSKAVCLTLKLYIVEAIRVFPSVMECSYTIMKTSFKTMSDTGDT